MSTCKLISRRKVMGQIFYTTRFCTRRGYVIREFTHSKILKKMRSTKEMESWMDQEFFPKEHKEIYVRSLRKELFKIGDYEPVQYGEIINLDRWDEINDRQNQNTSYKSKENQEKNIKKTQEEKTAQTEKKGEKKDGKQTENMCRPAEKS